MNTLSLIGLVFVGGGLGSISRYGVGTLSLRFFNGKFPIGTLIANFLACLILGVTVYAFKEKLTEHAWIKHLALVGFCGGFSTFSTFSIETFRLFQEQYYLLGFANIFISLLLGMSILVVFLK